MHRLISSRSSEPVHVKCADTLAAVNVTISKRGGYAARAAICLARACETGLPKKLREISAEMDIPHTFVSQIPALRRPHVTHPGTMVPLTPLRHLTQSGHQRSQPSAIKQLSGDLTRPHRPPRGKCLALTRLGTESPF